MRRVFILNMLFIAVAVIPLSATIINVPDDYPTIQEGINASENDDTVLVQPGIYYENVYLEEHTVVLASLFLTTGDTSYVDQTVIDGNSAGSSITFYYQNYAESNSMLIGFTIQGGYGLHGGGISCRYSDPIIANNIIKQNSTDEEGGGIFCWTGSNPTIVNNTISDNFAHEGGGLWSCYSHPTIDQNIIIHNTAVKGAGILLSGCDQTLPLVISNNVIGHNEGEGVYIQYSTSLLINNTITGNTGTGLYLEEGSNPTVLNTILWFNDPLGIYVDDWSDPIITYCDIQDTVWEDEGNISIDPIFCYPDTLNYYLQDDSPCVGAGQDGTNIGALGIGCYYTEMHELDELLPISFVTMQAFPNPFNSSTTIKYTLPKSSNLTISIYDVLGQQVEVLLKQFQASGKHQHTWRAKGLSSGIYFVLLETPDYTKSVSITLLK